jgi:hypothetical protein
MKPCVNWAKKGQCHHGWGCHFAHTDPPHRHHHPSTISTALQQSNRRRPQ